MKILPDFSTEEELWAQGYTVIGIDEVGRGALAGPLTLGGICFFPETAERTKSPWELLGVNDSKKLSSKRRTQLDQQIQHLNQPFYTVSVSVPTINTIGIVPAWKMAVAKLARYFQSSFPDRKLLLLIDGSPVKEIPYTEGIPRKEIPKGDARCITIASASIIAKVFRDQFMTAIGSTYPVYEWHENKGYGTKRHREAICANGATAWHRTQFIRSIVNK